MERLTSRKNHPCWAEFSCDYNVDNTCVFWEYAEAALSVMQEKYHKGASCYLNLINYLQKPCRELDEEGRTRGIKNILGPSE